MTIEIDAMHAQAERASTLLGAMANQKRLMILCRMLEGERSVGELAELLEMRQSTVSQHLALLKKDGFVQSRREGQTQYYSLVGNDVRRLLDTLYSIYCTPSAKRTRRARR